MIRMAIRLVPLGCGDAVFRFNFWWHASDSDEPKYDCTNGSSNHYGRNPRNVKTPAKVLEDP
jgi:hypothetical protein